MWPIKTSTVENERTDFGPDYGGVDYARFSDPQNIARDERLTKKLQHQIASEFINSPLDIDLKVKNGFAVVTGYLPDEEMKRVVSESILSVDGIVDIIWDIQ